MTTCVLQLLLLTVAQAPTAAPTFVRIAIVDGSGSMFGERIAVVRAELTKVIKQLPPSPEHPLLLIVFREAVAPTRVLTDAATAEQAIQSLNADGGTRIAPALRQAVKELEAYRHVGNVLVMLYTDGEDGDRAGILKTEEQLDALFAARGQEGLSQTVFVKRWGGANAELVERIKQRGQAKLLDAGEVEIQPVTIDPAVTLVRAERDPKNSKRLQVTYCPKVTVRGTLDPALEVGARFECLAKESTGQTTANSSPGETARHYTVGVPLSAEAEKAGKLDVSFRVHPSLDAKSLSKAVLPIIPSSLLSLPVPVPPLVTRHYLTAALKDARATGWVDPLAGQVRCTVDLVITVTPPDVEIGTDRKLVLRGEPEPGLVLLKPLRAIEIVKPGEMRLPIELEAALIDNKKRPLRTGPLGLSLTVASKPANLHCEPPVMVVRDPGVEQPAAVETTITPRVERITEAAWVDLINAVAAFDADVAIDVNGPLPHRSTLTLVSPAEVRNKVLAAGTLLRTGHNSMNLHVLAQLPPAKTQTLKFSILPPSTTAAVNLKVAGDISLSVAAPPPAKLVHMAGGRPQTLIRRALSDNQSSFAISLFPAALGVKRDGLANMPQVSAGSAGQAATITASPGSLFQPLPVELTMRPLAERPFFLDVAQHVDVELRPTPATAAVQGSAVRVAVVRQAPFKRLLIYLAWGLSPIGLIFVLFRIVRRLVEQPKLPPLCLERRAS